MTQEQTKMWTDQSVAAVQNAWGGANLAQRMVLAGGAVGFVSFFLPWQSIAFLWARGQGSGFTLARMGYTAYWAYPLLMAAVVFLMFRNLHTSAAQQGRAAIRMLAVGAGWTFFWVVGVLLRGDTSMLWGGDISLLACVVVWIGSAKLIGAALTAGEAR